MRDVAAQSDAIIGVTAPRAARIMGLSLKHLAAWELSGLVRPQTHRRLGGRHIRVYGIPELVELAIVRELRSRNVSIRRLRRIVEAHREEVPHPLRELRWAVDGRDVYVGFDDDTWAGGRRPRQGVIVEALNLEELRATVRQRALEREAHKVGEFEQRAGTLGHKKVFAGTRTPLAAVKPYIDRAMADEEILEAFPHLAPEDVAAARRELASA